MRQQSASPDNIDIAALFASIRRKSLLIAVLALAAAVLTYIALSLSSAQFVSQAELTIRSKGTANPFASPRGDGASSQVLTSLVDKQAVNTHVRALQSPDLAGEVAKKLRLARLREFNSALGPQDTMGRILQSVGFGGYDPNETERDRVQRAFFERLVVFSPSESRIITIGFRSSNPKLAADVANMMAQDYRQRLANATVVETDAVQKALQPKITQLAQEVTKAEALVAHYRAQTGLLQGGSLKTPLNQQQLGDLTTELTRASAARSALEAGAKTARSLILRGNPEIIPQVQRSPLIQSLIQQRVQVERDLRKLLATMKHAHPVIRQRNADLRAVKDQVAVEVANVVASIDKEAVVAVEREASIRKSLQALKAIVADTSDERVELSRLETVAKSKHDELARLRAQFESNRARADSGAVPVEAEIVTVARPASVASYPRKGSYTALVAVSLFLFGMAWVITSALLKGARPEFSSVGTNALRDEIAAVAAKPAPVLRATAGVAGASESVGNITTVSSAAELADRLLQMSNGTGSSCRTLLVSDGQNSQVGSLVKALGATLTGAKANTIVIDWSRYGRSMVASISDKVPLPGLTDLLKGTANFGEVVRALPGGNTHAITCGAAIPAGEKVDSEQLNVVLDALDEAYDQVVLVSALDSATELFSAISGRVDVGVLVGGATGGSSVNDRGNRFLGFEVEGVSIIRFIENSSGVRVSGPLSRVVPKFGKGRPVASHSPTI